MLVTSPLEDGGQFRRHIGVAGNLNGIARAESFTLWPDDLRHIIRIIDESPAQARDIFTNMLSRFPPEQGGEPKPAKPKRPKAPPLDAADVLNAMALTFIERNAVYKDNYKLVGPTMAALFPDGVQLKTPEDFETWHLFELVIVKLARFAASGLTHIDSPHDGACYLAMLEAILRNRNNEGNKA